MNLQFNRRIRDNLHGTIDLTDVEDQVLSHPLVQRLRRLKQTAFLTFVFPGASHSRFEHSVGVMHLAGKAWDRIRFNQQCLGEKIARIPKFDQVEQSNAHLIHGLLAPTMGLRDEVFSNPYHLQVLRLAGLLHDLGHPPFSHSGERFLSTWQTLRASVRDLPSYLTDFLDRKIEQLRSSGRDPNRTRVNHEVYSILLCDRVLRDLNQQDHDLAIDPRDVVSVIAPEIEPCESSSLRRHGVFRLLHEIVSGEFDIDRMDYLLRDSRECGVVYGIFDASRILDSLSIYQDPKDESLHLAIQFSGLAAFEDYLHARQSMYLQVYFHKTGVACEAMLQQLSAMLGGDWTLPADPTTYGKIDESNIAPLLEQAARERIGDPSQKEQFQTLCDDLLNRRRLWKRVFEVVEGPHDKDQTDTIQFAESIVRDLGVTYQIVSTSKSLTKFRPRAKDEPSRNYLKIIKKDHRHIPRVLPIEDYSSTISRNPVVNIRRIYVESGMQDGVPIAKRVQNKFSEALHPQA